MPLRAANPRHMKKEPDGSHEFDNGRSLYLEGKHRTHSVIPSKAINTLTHKKQPVSKTDKNIFPAKDSQSVPLIPEELFDDIMSCDVVFR